MCQGLPYCAALEGIPGGEETQGRLGDSCLGAGEDLLILLDWKKDPASQLSVFSEWSLSVS